jgi:hypothetical protein
LLPTACNVCVLIAVPRLSYQAAAPVVCQSIGRRGRRWPAVHAHVRCYTSQFRLQLSAPTLLRCSWARWSWRLYSQQSRRCTVTMCCDLQHNTGFPYGLPRDSSFRYSCVNNSVKLHMTTDDASMAPPPLSREYGGFAALHAVTLMCVGGMCGGGGLGSACDAHAVAGSHTSHGV